MPVDGPAAPRGEARDPIGGVRTLRRPWTSCTAWPAAGPAPATAEELQYHATPTTARFVRMLKFVMARGDLSPVVRARIDALLPDPMSRSDEIQRGREECLDGVEREPVSSSTSHSWPTLCIQVPISETSCPLQKNRKSRCRSAARRAGLGMAEGFTRAVGSARDRGAGCSTAARPRRRRSGPATAFSARQC